MVVGWREILGCISNAFCIGVGKVAHNKECKTNECAFIANDSVHKLYSVQPVYVDHLFSF